MQEENAREDAIGKLAIYVSSNGPAFEELARKDTSLFWWLSEPTSKEYIRYKSLLQIAEVKKRAAQSPIPRTSNTATTRAYAEDDLNLFDDIVGNIPERCRRANEGFQKGTYNVIDLSTAPKNVNDELLTEKSRNMEEYYEKREKILEKQRSGGWHIIKMQPARLCHNRAATSFDQRPRRRRGSGARPICMAARP